MKFTKVFACMALAGLAGNAFATNGMNLEGYGPISLGMGGAGMAFDSGTAATMINPATLGLMSDGSRLDIALGGLHPDINVSNDDLMYDQDSKSTSFFMPAIGYARKSGNLTYGIGLFAQGGMGAEYQPGLGSTYTAVGFSACTVDPLCNPGVFTPPDPTLGIADLKERSEVGVGRVILPLAYQASNQFTVGGSVDFVWAMMDLKMAMPGGQMAQMIDGGLIGGTLVDGLLGQFSDGVNPGLTNLYGGYFDFSDNSDFTGEAKGYGMAGKLGFTFKPTSSLTIGGTYHSKTNLSDLETDGAKVSMAVAVWDGVNAPVDMLMETTGKIKVKNFQWPETYGLGVAWQATDKMLLAADWKRINWSGVMENFVMSYTVTGADDPNMIGAQMTATMPQNWDDQDVVSLGMGYAVNDQLTVRAGYNHASNPIPSSTLNYLFPATVETHWTAGFGYGLSKTAAINGAISFAMGNDETMADGTVVDHSQTSWQLMYSKRF